MPVVITTTGASPTVGADFDTWGGELNQNITSVKVDLDALATQVNIDTPLASTALPKSGGTMTGDIALADVLPTSAFSAGFRGVPVIDLDADRTLLATDNGKMLRLSGVTARNWTIAPSVLSPSASIVLRNFGSAVLTITRGSGVALRVPGSSADANRTIAPQGYAVLTQEGINVFILSGTGVS